MVICSAILKYREFEKDSTDISKSLLYEWIEMQLISEKFCIFYYSPYIINAFIKNIPRLFEFYFDLLIKSIDILLDIFRFKNTEILSDVEKSECFNIELLFHSFVILFCNFTERKDYIIEKLEIKRSLICGEDYSLHSDPIINVWRRFFGYLLDSFIIFGIKSV